MLKSQSCNFRLPLSGAWHIILTTTSLVGVDVRGIRRTPSFIPADKHCVFLGFAGHWIFVLTDISLYVSDYVRLLLFIAFRGHW
jgi:hypothetical protein